MIYLDYASSSPVHEEILDAYHRLTTKYFYNNDALYHGAIELNQLYQKSKQQLLTMLKLSNYQVTYTSGATEANNLAIKGYAYQYQNRGKHLITTKVEHPSVLESFMQLENEGFNVTYLDVDHEGYLNLEQLQSALTDETILVSIMAVNNETGCIMPIKQIGETLKKHPKIAFHCDAVQALSKIDLPYSLIDMIVASAHKIGGLKGSGALIKKASIKLKPLIVGGSQEDGLRAGTVDAVKHLLFAKTMRIAFEQDHQHILELNHLLRHELEMIDDIKINSASNGSPYIINFSCIGYRSEVILNALSDAGIALSSRSTCSNQKNEPSHVLNAMGLSNELMTGALRVSLSSSSSKDDLIKMIDRLKQILLVIKKEAR